MSSWKGHRWLAIIFLVSVLLIHSMIVVFHLLMFTEGSTGENLRGIYYATSGRKEYWVFFDYYAPLLLMLILVFRLYIKKSFVIYLLAWFIAALSIVAMAPIYSTRLVPHQLSDWGGVKPAAFTPLPREKVPIVLALTIFSIVLKICSLGEHSEPDSRSRD